MKHTFLLDENIIVLAAKREDDHGRPDATCAELVLLIARNCHRIITNVELQQRYWRKINVLSQSREPVISTFVPTLAQLITNYEKTVLEPADLPELPEGAGIPPDDKLIVRSALRSQAPIVTTDTKLRNLINQQNLGTRGITPAEAVPLAEEK